MKLVVSRRGRADIVLVACLRVATALLTGVALVAIARLLAGIAEPSAGSRAVQAQEWTSWVPAALAALLAGVAAAAEIVYGGAAARREERSIRRRLLRAAYDTRSLSEAEGADAARLVTLHTDNCERVTEYRQVYFGSTVAAIAIPFLTLAYVAIAIDPTLGLTIMVLCPLIPLLLAVFAKFFRKTSANSRRQRMALAGKYLDAIRNLVIIRVFGAGPRIERQLRDSGEHNRGALMRLLAGNQVVIIIMDGLFSLVLVCCTAALVIARFHAGAIDLSQALAVSLLTVLLLEPLGQVAGFFYIGMAGRASERAIGAYLSKHGGGGVPGSSAPGQMQAMPPGAAQAAPEEAGLGGICARGVRFDYGRGPVLRGVDLDVPEGTKVAIVGESGGGKSTLLDLMRGSLALQDGEITIGGRQLRGMSPSQIRQLAAPVSQRTWLLTGSIADNLRLAKAEATDEEMWRALRQAQVADDVEAIGLHTDIGEQGARISGGQAQRIALARALLSGRKILLLDEPTSHVDIESEARITRAIGELGRRWTLLIVTHRRAIAESADAVVQMRDGVLMPLDISAPPSIASGNSGDGEPDRGEPEGDTVTGALANDRAGHEAIGEMDAPEGRPSKDTEGGRHD
ncbi:MAG: ATP-binding cassette domain-containing protein [Actinomycetaceae bacterium]|nr:ATP-binding cassette domain-containing protein [Actinomycetaceae bacterium]